MWFVSLLAVVPLLVVVEWEPGLTVLAPSEVPQGGREIQGEEYCLLFLGLLQDHARHCALDPLLSRLVLWKRVDGEGCARYPLLLVSNNLGC